MRVDSSPELVSPGLFVADTAAASYKWSQEHVFVGLDAIWLRFVYVDFIHKAVGLNAIWLRFVYFEFYRHDVYRQMSLGHGTPVVGDRFYLDGLS